MKKLLTIFLAIITLVSFGQGSFPTPVGYGSRQAAVFQQRVIDSSGTYLSNVYPHDRDELKSYGLDPVFMFSPAAINDGVLYSQLPVDGTGDFDVTRADIVSVINQYGETELVPANFPAIDYSYGYPVLVVSSDDTIQVTLPAGTIELTLTDKDGVESAGTIATPYIIPVGEWKSIIGLGGFTSTWNIADKSITLPTVSTGLYDAVVNWGDGTTSNITTYNQAEITHAYATNGVKTVTISGTFNGWSFNNAGDKLKITSIVDWGDLRLSNVVTTSAQFYGCSNLVSVNGTPDLTGTTTMSYMFNTCSSLTTLDVSGFDTGLVTNMNSMFYNCTSLTTLDVSGFDTGLVTSMSFMLFGCTSLTTLDVSLWDTGLVTTMGYMFGNCSSLTILDVLLWDTRLVTSMTSMLFGCTSLTTLDVSDWDTRLVTDMGFMFYNCSSLTTLDVSGFDTTLVTNMNRMFNGCSSLTTLGLTSTITTAWDIENVTSFGNFASSVTIPTAEYSNLLIRFAAQTVNDELDFNGGLSKYTAAGKTARDILTNATNLWTITDGGPE